MVERLVPVLVLAVVLRRQAPEQPVAPPAFGLGLSAALGTASRRRPALGSAEPVSAVLVLPASKPRADAGFRPARIRLATAVVVPVPRRDYAARTLPAAGS